MDISQVESVTSALDITQVESVTRLQFISLPWNLLPVQLISLKWNLLPDFHWVLDLMQQHNGVSSLASCHGSTTPCSSED